MSALDWQKNAVCAEPENRKYANNFFSSEPSEKYIAKNLCFSCPIREACLKYALEHRQINGIWGGKDEGEIRRALSVSWDGKESRRERFPQCPFCNARPGKLQTQIVTKPKGGRWATMRIVVCTACGFTWQSRTSANAVDAYHIQRADTLAKQSAKNKTKKKKVKQIGTKITIVSDDSASSDELT
jgi:WhiB family redox-sensing transcriptional regulator